MTYRVNKTLIALAVASFSLQLAAEESTQKSIVLETLEVKGQAYRNTATKTQLEVEETPQAITVISNNELEAQNVDSIEEALRYVSGVDSELRGGTVNRYSTFGIRGFQNDVVLYDGLQLLYLDGWNLVPQIHASTIEQIEVFKGPTSALYGAAPPGGTINIISKAPQKEDKTVLDLSLGSDKKRELVLDSTGSINEGVTYRVIARAHKSDGQAVTSEFESVLFAPSLDINLSDDTTLNINMYYQHDPEMGINSTLPSKGTVYSNVNGQLSSDAYAGDINWEGYDREVLLVGYKLNHNFNDTWSFLQNARTTFAETYQQNTYLTALSNDETTITRTIYDTAEEEKGLTIDNQLSATFNIGETDHNILVGIDYTKLKGEVTYGTASTTSQLNLYDPDYNQIDPSSLSFTNSDYTIDREQTGAYFQDQILHDNWVFIAGGRVDKYQYTGGGAFVSEIDQAQFSGRVGALYALDNGVSPFVNYAQSFEPVAGEDKDGNDFDTSTADQWEAGIKYESFDLSATLMAFNIIKSNVKTDDPDSSDTSDLIQVGEVRSRGVEVEVKKVLSSATNVGLTYTLLDIEVTKDNSGYQGNTPIWSADNQFNIWLNYQPSQGSLLGSSFGVGVRYVGEMQIDAANSGTVPSYTLVDLSVGYDLAQLSADWKGASVQFAAANAFDETYYTCYDTSSCWFGADRSFELKGRYEF